MSDSKVYLVGSGPGSLDLLTMRAFNLIKQADVIVYDRLVSDEIMGLVGQKTVKHYVGKQESDHTIPQNEINELLVHYAKRFKKVVRLKGGDPFVFGRGGEEVGELVKNHIAYEIVPGISSSIAALSYAGIPITHRGVSNNFAVLAGHTCTNNGLDEIDWPGITKIGTVVILMGVRNRSKIAKYMIDAGKSPATPAAFIERATTHDQKVITATLEEIANGDVSVESPAVFAIGEVVNFHQQWKWFLEANSLFKFEVKIGY